jgi:Protein of unknown function (DUF2934)
MSLIHYVRPFLELGICKESSMARKTKETTTSSRSKKTQVPDPPAVMQVTPEVRPEIHAQVPRDEFRKDVPKIGISAGTSAGTSSGKSAGPSANYAPINLASQNVEEQIRLRAYELYLQRRATAGAGSGDENQDWLIAEREIRSRHGGRNQFSAAAGRA